jgi:hypothetical protein
VSAPTATVPPPAGPPAPTGRPPAEPPPPSVKARRLWRFGGSVIAVILLPFGVLNVVSQLAHEEHTEVREFPAEGIRLIEVHNSTGHVRIVGDERGAGSDGTITVTTHVSTGLRKTGHSQRIDGDRLLLDATCPSFLSSFCEVVYTIDTPPGVDVLVRAEIGVAVEGIDGDVDVSADQGSVELSRIGGTLRADSDQGSVRGSGLRSSDVEATTDQGGVALRFDAEPRRVVVDSDQGDVEVVVPTGDAFYRLDTDTDQGRVVRDIRTDPLSDRSITATTDQGNVLLRYP